MSDFWDDVFCFMDDLFDTVMTDFCVCFAILFLGAIYCMVFGLL